MALIIGLLLLVLGVVALSVWVAEVLIFLKGLVVFSLLLWGTLSLIVGYAGWKGKRQTRAALNDEPRDEEAQTQPTFGKSA